MSTDGMPDRYAPDPWIDRDVSPTGVRERPTINFPVSTLREWLGVDRGTVLGVAPRSERAVTVGPSTPAILGTFQVSETLHGSPCASVPRFVCDYVNATPGDTLRFRRVDGDCLRIERVGSEP